jgi:hypothetical protein
MKDRTKARIRYKHFRLDSIKLLRAKKLLRADTETETIERALDLVISEYRGNLLRSEANERFLDSGIKIKNVHGGLGTDIAPRFRKVGFMMNIPELRGHGITPASFGPKNSRH